MKFFKKLNKKEETVVANSKEAAKERLHLVLMQDRANVSVDFLELMKQEIIEVIKKYIDVDENAIDVRLTNKENNDGTNGAPALYANIPILNIKNEARKVDAKEEKEEPKKVAEEKPTKKDPKKVEKEVKEVDNEMKNIQENVDIIIDDGSEDAKNKIQIEENNEIEENNKEKPAEEKEQVKSEN